MNAGRGIVHSERTAKDRKASGQKLFGLQTWMASPLDQEESAPAFSHYAATDLPVVDADGVKARLISGEVFGARSPLVAPSETLYADIQLEAGRTIPIDPTTEERALYTISGAIEIAGDRFEPGQLLILRPSDDITVLAVETSRFMLFGGAPMEGPRYIWWNFVSSRLERIEQAKEEWARGRFETVPGDEEEFIPLPEDAGRPRKANGGGDVA